MTTRALSTAASWTVFAGTAAMSISAAALPSEATFIVKSAYEAFVYTAIGGLGVAVTQRRPANAVGWLLQLIALVLALNALGNYLYLNGTTDGREPGAVATLAAWFISWLWIFAIVPAFAIFPLIFPTGRPMSPRWGLLLRGVLVVTGVTWFGTAFAPGPLEGAPDVDNPVAIDLAAVEVVGWASFLLLVPATLAAIASLFLRFRRSTGPERQQLKWVVAAAALLPVGFTGAGLAGESGFLVLLTALLLVVVAVAVAMLRHRLYDIDVVINRTLVYGSLLVCLAASYAGSVLLLQLALRPVTRSSDLAVAGSTLAVAALFRPARDQIRRIVDRRFYRSRYDAARALAGFTEHLRDQLDADAVAASICHVVDDTMRPAHVSVWVASPTRAGAMVEDVERPRESGHG